jgi:hypothetical protein
MVAQTLVLVAMIAIVATSVIAGIAGYARAETATAAKALVQPSIDAALARYESTVLAPAIAASLQPGDGSAAPASASALNGGVAWSAQQYVLAPNGPSPLAAVVLVTPTATAVPACVPAGGSTDGGPDVENHGQCSGFVQESRLSLTLNADVGPPSGSTSVAPIAHGRDTVTLRLFAQPPYVMVAGVADDAAPGDPHEGDLGGYGNALGAFGPSPSPDDTSIHVIFACTPAQGDCSASHPAPQDDPTSLPWTNGNVNPSS